MQFHQKVKLFGSVKVLALAAVLVALSVVIGVFCKLYLTFGGGALRVTFENIPIIFAGVAFGPFIGMTVGIASDLCSCIIAGNAINPVIMLGAAAVGCIAGFMPRRLFSKEGFFPTIIAVYASHLVGSVIIKTSGLYMWGFSLGILVWRIPLYVAIGLAEAFAINALLKNKQISKFTVSMKNDKK